MTDGTMRKGIETMTQELDEGPEEAWTKPQRLLVDLSQSVSRRSALTRAGQALLGLMGFVVAYKAGQWAMPDDALATTTCDDCQDSTLCGIYGVPCGAPTCAGNCSACPAGMTRGTSYWSQCCLVSDGIYKIIKYYDCCRSKTPCTQPDDRCQVPFCANNSVQPTWCAAGTNCYWCSQTAVTFMTC